MSSYGDLRLRSRPSLRLGSRPFQRFTARQGLFWHLLVMNSPEVHGWTYASLHRFIRARFRVSLTIRRSPYPFGILPYESRLPFSLVRSRNSWVSPQPFCEARGFSPLLESLPDPFFAFLVPLGGGQDSASDITSRCSPSSHPFLTLLRQGPDGHRY